jgi:hypothetical protein
MATCIRSPSPSAKARANLLTGAGDAGAVRLPGAHISGVLKCTGAALRNDSGPALVAGCGPARDPASHRDPASWIGLPLLAWAFAALFIAGFTSAVRKT